MAQQQPIEQDAAARRAELTVVPDGVTLYEPAPGIAPSAEQVEAIRAILGDGPTVAEHLASARDLHAAAVRHLDEARRFEQWPTYAYKGAALRDDATDDLLSAFDTLLAVVTGLAEGQREQNANMAGMLELVEALIPEAD